MKVSFKQYMNLKFEQLYIIYIYIYRLDHMFLVEKNIKR